MTQPVAPGPQSPVPSQDDPTIGKLVADATRDISTLVSKEIELVKSELKLSVRAGGAGLGLVAGALLLVILATIVFTWALVYLIHWSGEGLALQWAFLIVFAFYLLIAALLGWLAVRKFKQVGPPEKAIEQGREIPKALKGGS